MSIFKKYKGQFARADWKKVSEEVQSEDDIQKGDLSQLGDNGLDVGSLKNRFGKYFKSK